MRSVDDLEVLGRRVLLRSDLNVPLDLTGTGEITDDGRIRASLPVISKLSDRGARVIILAHLGRPKGDSFAERAAGGPSLRPVAERLGQLLGRPVGFATDVAGESASKTAFSLGDEDVAVLENVRFEPAETSKDDAERGAFAQQLARFGELYVDDAFGAVHRKHASVYDLPALLPHAAGDLVRAEVSVLRQLTTDPERPFVVVLGGKKPSDKLAVIGNLLGLADRILPLMAGNWKMHENHLEAIALVQKLAFTLTGRDYDFVEVAVLPPFTALRSVQTLIDGDKLRISYGAQDLSPYDSGAYTGDVSGPMLAKLGCDYVLAGHSERRQYHHETDEVVNAKVQAALRSGLTPILCLGEPLDVRQVGRAGRGTASAQLDGSLARDPGRGGGRDGDRLRAGLGHRHR